MGTGKSFEEIQEFNKNMKEIEQDKKREVLNFISFLMREHSISLLEIEVYRGVDKE